jgi:hypothetical protein
MFLVQTRFHQRTADPQLFEGPVARPVITGVTQLGSIDQVKNAHFPGLGKRFRIKLSFAMVTTIRRIGAYLLHFQRIRLKDYLLYALLLAKGSGALSFNS